MTIEKAVNGYVVTRNTVTDSSTWVYPTLELAFERLLEYFEGRSREFKGTSYGHVKIVRGTDEAAKIDNPANG